MKNKALINEYIDISVAHEAIEGDEQYAASIGYWRSDSKLCKQLNDRKNELELAILRTHPYFKKSSARTVFSMGEELLIAPFAEGKVQLIYDGGWGDAAEGKVLTNPTYLDMYAEADKLVRQSGDLHHIFVEDMTYEHTVKGVRIYSLWCGS